MSKNIEDLFKDLVEIKKKFENFENETLKKRTSQLIEFKRQENKILLEIVESNKKYIESIKLNDKNIWDELHSVN